MSDLGRKMRKSIVQVLCLLLLVQGYPVLALQEAGFTVEPDPPPIGEWVEHGFDEARRPLGRWRSAWRRAWEPLWASASAAGEELAWEWEVASWAVAGALGLSGPGGGGGEPQPPMPTKPDYKAAERPQPAPFEVAPELIAGKNALHEILLVPGWNLVSLPKAREATDPATVLESIAGGYTHVMSHDACDAADPWKLYDPENPEASDLEAIDPTTGLWLEATLPVDLLPEGELPASVTFELCTGWNLVGFPAGQARPVRNALRSIDGKYIRVMAYESYDADDPWKIYDVEVPSWANDLAELRPGRAYWVLATEDAELTIANEGAPPSVSLTVPEDLAVITAPTDVLGTVESALLKEWTLSYRAIGDGDWLEIESGVVPVASGKLGVFDPTLLLNGLYEIRLTASDYQGRTVEGEPIAVSVEGNMKMGRFTLTFVDLAIPLSGLDIEVVRTYDSRDKRQGDFGVGWALDIHQGSYRNNRLPGDGWQFSTGFLPCDSITERKSHLTTIRLSDREIYRFALRLHRGAPTLGGCFAEASFEFVDGPVPGSTLTILDSTEVFFANGTDRVVDPASQGVYVPQNVRLVTRDGRVFHLNLDTGVTHLEDLSGNALEISTAGITHSSGVGIDFVRDSEGRIRKIVDPRGNTIVYGYDSAGDLIQNTGRAGAETQFVYRDHYLEDIRNALGVRAVRTEYDEEGRMIKVIDALGEKLALGHDLDARREVMTNQLGLTRIVKYVSGALDPGQGFDAVAQLVVEGDYRTFLLVARPR